MSASRKPQVLLISLFVLLTPLLLAAQTGDPQKGPPIGQALPTFEAHDQFNRKQTLASLTGKNGLVLLFFRSADW